MLSVFGKTGSGGGDGKSNDSRLDGSEDAPGTTVVIAEVLTRSADRAWVSGEEVIVDQSQDREVAVSPTADTIVLRAVVLERRETRSAADDEPSIGKIESETRSRDRSTVFVVAETLVLYSHGLRWWFRTGTFDMSVYSASGTIGRHDSCDEECSIWLVSLSARIDCRFTDFGI